jgi:acylpyruvate hydrolase
LRLVNYLQGVDTRSGFLLDDRIFDIEKTRQAWLRHGEPGAAPIDGVSSFGHDLTKILQGGEPGWRALAYIYTFLQDQSETSPNVLPEAIHLEAAKLLPPVLRPGKIVCVGLNYPPAGDQEQAAKPEYPVLFHKVITCLIGNKDKIVLPRISQQVEYEAELAIIIGKGGKYIPRQKALQYIAGYTIANDLGAKDIERRTSQWTSGKMLDSFCPLGPALVTPNEAPEPNALRITTKLNGELVQDDNTAEMYFDVPYLISYISSLATLEPGDVILSGSPKRVGAHPDPRKRLQPGDRLMIEIERIGQLINPVVAEEV